LRRVYSSGRGSHALDRGADVNAQNDVRWIALYFVCYVGQVKFLIDHDANVDCWDDNQATPLAVAPPVLPPTAQLGAPPQPVLAPRTKRKQRGTKYQRARMCPLAGKKPLRRCNTVLDPQPPTHLQPPGVSVVEPSFVVPGFPGLDGRHVSPFVVTQKLFFDAVVEEILRAEAEHGRKAEAARRRAEGEEYAHLLEKDVRKAHRRAMEQEERQRQAERETMEREHRERERTSGEGALGMRGHTVGPHHAASRKSGPRCVATPSE
jgi:hypothetical protein